MTLRHAIASAALLLAAGCSSSPSTRDCVEDADCGGENVCHRGTCSANGPPVASFDAPASATTHRVITLQGTSSDPEGRPVEHRWSIRAVAGGCDPEPEPVVGGSFDVVFWCAGTYEATLVPVDDLGAEGAPVGRTFEVAMATNAPTVETGAAISATHLCDQGLSVCHVAAPDGSSSLRLSALGADPGSAPLSFEWLALPPARAADDPSLAVTFAPGTNVDKPTASITNAGGAIGGVYRFRVRVRNPQGLIAQAYQEVVVANSVPTVAPATFLLPHQYAGGLFVAEAELDTGALDPDGDRISLRGVLSPAPPAGCTEAVEHVADGRLHVRIECSIATALIGETPRTLSVTIEDANGGATAYAAPLPIENRPPQILLAPGFAGGVLAVDHRVEPCRLATGAACFVADGTDPVIVTDPDGDPLSQPQFGATVAAGRAESKGSASVDGATFRFRFETPVAFPAQFRSAAGASGFTLSATVQDSWGASASATLPLTIRNGAPFVKEPLAAVSVPHHYDAARRRYLADASGALFEDPDGDPLVPSVQWSRICKSVTLEAGRAAIGCELAWDYTLGGVPPLSDFLTGWPATVSASDGWGSASSTTAITITDRPATVSAPMKTVESCACVAASLRCDQYEVTSKAMPLPIELADPDGDPAQIKVYPDWVTAPSLVTCLPGWCYAKVDGSGIGSIGGYLYARTSSFGPTAEARFNVAPVCSNAGTCCN